MERKGTRSNKPTIMLGAISMLWGTAMLAVALMLGIIAPTQARAQSIDDSTYWSNVNGFLNDGRWSNGISWASGMTPKLNTSWSSTGCCAYAADFAAYTYGLYGRSVNSMTPFYSASEIRTGDIIHTVNPEHWFVVLKRDGDNLYTAEGNYLSKVRASLSTRGYFVSGNTLYQAYTNSSARMSFSVGYHANIISNRQPFGNLDVCERGSGYIRVRGWAYDPDNSSASINVHVYIGGASGASGATCIPIPAHTLRSDVNSSYGISGNHGFDFYLFTDRNGSQEVHAYAIDTAGGSNSDIGSRTVYCTARTSNGAVEEGIYCIVPANATGMCLDVANASTADEANVQLYTRNNSLAQQWRLTKLSDGSFKIISLASGKALDVYGASADSGANIEQYTWNNTSAQHWFLVSAGNGYYYFTPKCSALCMDVYDAGTANGTNITQYWCHTSSNQKFKLVRVEETGIDINEANFPDPIFRSYVSENFDLTGGGKLSDYEISQATTVFFAESDVASLKGIEYLTALSDLTCYKTKVAELDLSKNTSLKRVALGDAYGSNPFTDSAAVIASLPKSVSTLMCGSMSLSGELDLSSFTSLNFLNCANNQITRLVLLDSLMGGVSCSNNNLTCVTFKGRGGNPQFDCTGNTRTVEVAENGTFDLSTLEDFDVSRAFDWAGGTVDGTTLTFTSDEVTYTYDCDPTYTAVHGYVASNRKGYFTLIRSQGASQEIDLSGASIAAIPDQTFTGSAITPELVVTLDGRTLTEDTDYTVSYSNNVNAGTATATIVGKGNYAGTKAATFKIVESGSGPSPSAPFFLDADPADEANHGAEVDWMGRMGISEGWPAEGGRVFNGLWNVKRCDFAAFLYRMADLTDDGERNDSCMPTGAEVLAALAGVSDCDASTAHSMEVAWLVGTGISRGWDNGDGTVSFRPTSDIKRQDMAAFLHRFADLTDDGQMNGSPQMGPQQLRFSDVAHGDEANHASDVEWLASVGVTRGWDNHDGTYSFGGLRDIVRQDMAAFMKRLYDHMAA